MTREQIVAANTEELQKFAKEVNLKITNNTECKNCLECILCNNCFNCLHCTTCGYCINCLQCSICAYCELCLSCTNCSDCKYCCGCAYCVRCTNCFNSIGLLGAEYVFCGVQLTEDEYMNAINKMTQGIGTPFVEQKKGAGTTTTN